MSPTPNLELLFELEATTGESLVIGDAGTGTKAVVPVTGGTFAGPRLNGRVRGSANGDWVTMLPNGSIRLDVRLTLETNDGALILMTYEGVGRRTEQGYDLRTAPRFETGDERYRWLNEVQAVAVGTASGNSVRYSVFALS